MPENEKMWSVKCGDCGHKFNVSTEGLFAKTWYEAMAGEYTGAFTFCKCGEECIVKAFFENEGTQRVNDNFVDLPTREEFMASKKDFLANLKKPRFTKEQLEILKKAFGEMGYSIAELIIFEETLMKHAQIER